MDRLASVRDNWRHLRIAFQFTLAPIFLWGWLASGAPVGARLLPAFAALHLFLYTGVTAFNSYYDRDEGPIGGLETPPPVHSSLLITALCLKTAGLILALWVGLSFAAVYLLFAILSVLYSHPRTRWKARPWLSAAVVCLGQGGLGCLAGWAAARGGFAGVLTVRGLLAIAAAALTTLGMYPVSQVYQVDEDRARGDVTLCVALGSRGGLAVAQAAFTLAAVAATASALLFLTPIDALILCLAYALLIGAAGILRASARSASALTLFYRTQAFCYLSATAFALYLLVRLARA